MTTAAAPAPVGVDGFFQPRRAAFWLLVFFLAKGLYTTVTLFAVGFRVVPVTVLLGLAVWTLFTLPLLLLFRWLDLHLQHPRSGFALAFAWGGLGAVYLAVPANQAVIALCAKLGGPEFCERWSPALAGPTNEESLKLLGVALLVLVARTQFRTVLSVMAVGAMAGLGFQVVEDLFYTVNGSLNYSNPDEIAPVAQMFIVRGFLCGPWSHTAYTTVASFGLGYFHVHREQPLARRLGVALAAFATAWLMHFLWNSRLLSEAFPGLYLLLYLVLKGGPALLALLLIWLYAQHEENRHVRALADHYVAPDLITPEERVDLGIYRRRVLARLRLRRAHGRRAARALGRLQHAQLRLVRYLGENGPGPQLAAHEAAVRDHRARLAALAADPASPGGAPTAA